MSISKIMTVATVATVAVGAYFLTKRAKKATEKKYVATLIANFNKQIDEAPKSDTGAAFGMTMSFDTLCAVYPLVNNGEDFVAYYKTNHAERYSAYLNLIKG